MFPELPKLRRSREERAEIVEGEKPDLSRTATCAPGAGGRLIERLTGEPTACAPDVVRFHCFSLAAALRMQPASNSAHTFSMTVRWL